jgi:DNA repair protein RadC
VIDAGKELDHQWWLAPDASPVEGSELQVLESTPDADLIGLLLAGASDPESARAASELLGRVNGLQGLLTADERTLSLLSLPRPAATRLAAARELACRLARLEIPEAAPLSRPADLARYLGLRYQAFGQKVLGAVFIRSDGRLIGIREIFRGSPHRCSVEPAPVLREALLLNAARVVLFLTRPGGDPTPIQADRDAARLFEIGLESIGIRLHDFLVIADATRWRTVTWSGG